MLAQRLANQTKTTLGIQQKLSEVQAGLKSRGVVT
jgi:hypothetical protein